MHHSQFLLGAKGLETRTLCRLDFLVNRVYNYVDCPYEWPTIVT